MAESSTVPQRTYHFIEENHAVREGDGMPTADVLEEANSAIGAVEEFLIDPIRGAVAGVLAGDDRRALTLEEVGRLVVFADQIYDRAREISETAQVLSYMAREGWNIDSVFPFDAKGYIVDRREFERWRSSLVPMASRAS